MKWNVSNYVDMFVDKLLNRYEKINAWALYSMEKVATGGNWKRLQSEIMELRINLSSTAKGEQLEPCRMAASYRSTYGKKINKSQFETCCDLENVPQFPLRYIRIAVLRNFIDQKGVIQIDEAKVRKRSYTAVMELVFLIGICTAFLLTIWSLFIWETTFQLIFFQLLLLVPLSVVGIFFWFLASYQVFIYGIVQLAVARQLEEILPKFAR